MRPRLETASSSALRACRLTGAAESSRSPDPLTSPCEVRQTRPFWREARRKCAPARHLPANDFSSGVRLRTRRSPRENALPLSLSIPNALRSSCISAFPLWFFPPFLPFSLFAPSFLTSFRVSSDPCCVLGNWGIRLSPWRRNSFKTPSRFPRVQVYTEATYSAHAMHLARDESKLCSRLWIPALARASVPGTCRLSSCVRRPLACSERRGMRRQRLHSACACQ